MFLRGNRNSTYMVDVWLYATDIFVLAIAFATINQLSLSRSVDDLESADTYDTLRMRRKLKINVINIYVDNFLDFHKLEQFKFVSDLM